MVKKSSLMDFDGKSLHPSATVDKGSFISRIETGFLCNPYKERDFLKHFYKRTSTQLTDYASAILVVRFYNSNIPTST